MCRSLRLVHPFFCTAHPSTQSLNLMFNSTSHHTTTTTVLRPSFQDHPGELVPEENFCTLWCKERLPEADIPTIRLGATPSRLTSAHLHHPPIFLQAGCPSCRPTNSEGNFTILHNWPDTPKMPLPMGASTFPCNACSLETHQTQHPKLHLCWFSCFCTAQRRALYVTMCVKTRLTCD